MSKSSVVATTRRVRGFTEGRTAVLTLEFLQAVSPFVLGTFVRSSAARLPTLSCSGVYPLTWH
jgi:hypothetical protein